METPGPAACRPRPCILSTFLWDTLIFPPVRLAGRIVFALYFRGRILRDQPAPSDGPFILVGNHTSILDGILVHGVSRRALRIFVAAEWVAWAPLRLLFRIMGAIPVDRDRRNPDSFEAAVAALERGEPVALFPEGGIREDGTLGPFRHGAARLALRTGAPVVPSAIIGSHRAQPWPRPLPRPSRITIRSGEILRFPAASEGRLRPEDVAAATDRIREAMRRLIERGHDARSVAPSPALGGDPASRGAERSGES